MDHAIDIRSYAELKLENIRLRNELAAQKEMYDRCIEEFRALLNETSDLYTNEIDRLKQGLPPQSTGPDRSTSRSIPSSLPSVVTKPPKEKVENERPKSLKRSRSLLQPSTCIQEHTKKAPKLQQVVSFTESALKRVILSALLKNSLEEFIYVTLQPRFTQENIQNVLFALLSSMQQSFSLLKTYEIESMNQKVSLFSSLLFFITTRFPEANLENTCLDRLQSEINAELSQTYSHSKFDRFSPSFIASFLVIFDLCMNFDSLPLFKLSLYSVFTRCGTFPLHLVNALFLHNQHALDQLSECDIVINCIIGETLRANEVSSVEFEALCKNFADRNEEWKERLNEMENNALQYIVDDEGYSVEDPKYIIAGRCLILFYVYRGGKYAVRSLVENEIIRKVEDPSLSRDYRTFLLYIILWTAEANLFGGEWTPIRQELSKLDILTDAIRTEFNSLFSSLC